MGFKRSKMAAFRVWVSNQPFSRLLVYWLVIYFLVGLIFSFVYWKILDPAISSPCWVDALLSYFYFSLTTLSTLGYGDLAPHGVGRLFSSIEAFLGISLNAIVLGIVVFKALRRSLPLELSDLLYDQPNRYFRLRFMNVDADRLRDITMMWTAVKKLTLYEADETHTYYDTIATSIPTDLKSWTVTYPFRIMGIKSLQHPDIVNWKQTSLSDNFASEAISPEIFFRGIDVARSFEVFIEVSGSGYFESTGEQFFFTKIYEVNDIKCGRFTRMSNNDLELLQNVKERLKSLDRIFTEVELTPENQCKKCGFFDHCRFSRAVSLKAKNG